MSARKTANRINLLPSIEFATSTWGRILTWALSGFRIIVISIEMIVMLAFMSRFWLDAKSNDLNDAIRERTSVIKVWSSFETKFKATQQKLAVFSQVTQQANSVSSTLAKVTSYLPNEITLTSFTFTSGQVNIKGVSTNEMSIAQLAANLQADKSFTGIAIESITTNSDNLAQLAFSFKFDLLKGGLN
jgi:hypothetical protein